MFQAKPTLPRDNGVVLSIDQASNNAGVSIWRDGLLLDTTVLDGGGGDVFSRRVAHQVPQLTAFLDRTIARNTKVSRVIFEGVRARLVMVTVGAYLTCPRIDAKLHQEFSFVETSSWKNWARNNGATGPFKDIKGIRALEEVGFPLDHYDRMTDDIADSILQYLAWRELH